MLDADGTKLVRLARQAVKYYLEKQIIKQAEKTGPTCGVFVTLNSISRDKQHLRGCIGFPTSNKTLYQSVVEAAIAAATQDPRFPPVSRSELNEITFEVSVLTEPQEVLKKGDIRIGRDGLIFHWKYGSALLLPQVPVEFDWDIEEYLVNLCYKAGAPLDALTNPSSRLYRFQAEVFKEFSPSGKVKRLEQYK